MSSVPIGIVPRLVYARHVALDALASQIFTFHAHNPNFLHNAIDIAGGWVSCIEPALVYLKSSNASQQKAQSYGNNPEAHVSCSCTTKEHRGLWEGH